MPKQRVSSFHPVTSADAFRARRSAHAVTQRPASTARTVARLKLDACWIKSHAAPPTPR